MNNLSPILTPLCRFLTPSDHHLSTNQDVLFLSLMNISFWVTDFEGLQMCWGKGPGLTDMHLWELDSPLWGGSWEPWMPGLSLPVAQVGHTRYRRLVFHLPYPPGDHFEKSF